VVGHIGMHGSDDAELISMSGGFAKQVADHESAFAAGAKSPWRRVKGSGGAFCGEVSGGDFFTAAALEFGFVVECVDV